MLTASALLMVLATAEPSPRRESAWSGLWTLNTGRSSAEAREGAAGSYRFTIEGTSIRWEIPSLGEVVTGRTDGWPMIIRRHGKAGSMTLSVTAGGPYVLRYAIAKAGRPFGAGVMTLVEGGRAWVDISWAPGEALNAAQLLYRKRSGASRP